MSTVMNMVDLEKLISVAEVAEHFGVRPGIVRRAAKKEEIPGAIKVVGKYGFDPVEMLKWVPPEPGTRRVGAKRADGRQRYNIWLTLEEEAGLAPKYEIVDPRERAKARRAAKKAAAAEGGATAESTDVADADVKVPEGGDPFATFGDE